MTPSKASALIAETAGAIEAERQRLMRGDIAGLDEAAQKRAEALAAIERLSDEDAAAVAPKIEALRAAAARHAEALSAALSGARAARKRLQEMADARMRLPGYDASGTPRVTSGHGGLSSRRV